MDPLSLHLASVLQWMIPVQLVLPVRDVRCLLLSCALIVNVEHVQTMIPHVALRKLCCISLIFKSRSKNNDLTPNGSHSMRSDGSNQCASSNTSDECSLESSFFAAVAGSGSSCSDFVNMSVSTVPSGCGCAPDRSAPCSYNSSTTSPGEACFVCTAADLAQGVCPACDNCLSTYNECITSANTKAEYVSCLALISYAERNDCRGSCTKF